MTMDPDTPLRLNLSLGEENVELKRFFEESVNGIKPVKVAIQTSVIRDPETCLLYTSPSPRDRG